MAVLGRSLRRFTTLLLFVCLFAGSISWRRRRGGCTCSWNSWGSWSSCSEPCGNTGTRTRTRTGSCCGTAGTETGACNRFCYNSGTPSGNGCICTSQYQGRCCDVDKPQGDEFKGGSSETQQGGTTVSIWVYVGGGGGTGSIILFIIIYVCCKSCG
ncbi:ectin-like [Branchiostoma floridae]|uniref:Ectin-like n=1 Tax=Branchiostoma floridae TaxID=7739 RepID=A0A9J7M4N8_BRAFL|nr:ectin-like [Branchiostoma floridae]